MEQPPLQPTPVGAFRFNADSAKMEYYDGNQWVNITSSSPEKNTGGCRGLINLGCSGPNNGGINTIDYINISSTGDAVDFGDDHVESYGSKFSTGAGSRTRAVWTGSYNPATTSCIRYNTIQTLGNSIDFGDMSWTAAFVGGCSNETRKVIYGGDNRPSSPTAINNIDYITIASTGNSSTFGEASYASKMARACSSPTRGVFCGGYAPNGVTTTSYITFSTTGNGADWGDLKYATAGAQVSSNSIRGYAIGGKDGSGNRMDDVSRLTIATLGSAVSFTELGRNTGNGAAVASPTRICACGGAGDPSWYTQIDYTAIMSDGVWTDFGDLTDDNANSGGTSNGHGGLG